MTKTQRHRAKIEAKQARVAAEAEARQVAEAEACKLAEAEAVRVVEQDDPATD